MARILLVDDEPLNLELLHAHLQPLGHALVDAMTGEDAIEKATAERFDLVLLDVMMPGMSGFDAAERLKQLAAERDEYLPVLLVTALSDPDSRRRGLRAGADEFLTKPIDGIELTLRMNNLLRLRSDRVELKARNDRLVELQRFKDEMAALIIHDLRTPASVVLANLHYVLDLLKATPDLGQVREALDDAHDGCRRLLRLLANLLDVARAEDNCLIANREAIDLATIITPLVSARGASAHARLLRFATHLQPGCIAPLDADLVSRIVENVLDNAMRYTPRGGTITISTRQASTTVELRIGNTGPAIPPENRGIIFEKYGRVGPMVPGQHANNGLGLYFCRLAVEAHGGKIWIEEEPEMPTVFVMCLPTSDSLPIQ